MRASAPPADTHDRTAARADDRGLLAASAYVRIKISAAWTAMLFVFAYVDMFSLYRPDVRAQLQAGTLAGFDIGDPFLTATTGYVVLPSLLIVATLALRAPVARWLNVILGAVYAFTVVAASIGEMTYYLLGSVVEVGLLVAIVRWAWHWPHRPDDAV